MEERRSAGRKAAVVWAISVASVALAVLDVGTAAADPPEPIAAYSFDVATESTVEDVTGGGHVGVLEGVGVAEGKFGNGLRSNGAADECLTITDGTGLAPGSHYTWEGWLKTEGGEGPQSIMVDEGGEEDGLVDLRLSEAGHLEASLSEESGGPVTVVDPSEVRQGEWTFVALTYDGSEAILYADGEPVAAEAVPDPMAFGGPIRVGCSPGSEDGFSGAIDEVRIYAGPLGEAEILSDMESPLPTRGVQLMVFGQVAEAGDHGVVGSQAPLTVEAGSPEGVQEVDLRVDGELVQTMTREEALQEGAEASCEADLCSLRFEFERVFAPQTSAGPHTVSVTAISKAGQASYSKEVEVDAGVPVLELAGGLSAAEGVISEGSATLTAKATDPGGDVRSGIKTISIYVDGSFVGGSEEVCEPRCPDEGEASYEYSTESWGVGPHELMITVVDGSGNEVSETLPINQTITSIEPACYEPEPTLQTEEVPETTADAVERIGEVLPAATAPAVVSEAGEYAGIDPAFVEGPSPREGHPAFLAKGGLVGGRVVSGSGAFTVGQGTCLAPLQSTDARSSGTVLEGSGAVVYTDTAQEADTLLRNSGLGTTLVESFRGAAPTSMSWEVASGSETVLEELANGAIAIVAPSGRNPGGHGHADEEIGELSDPESIANVPQLMTLDSEVLAKANEELRGEIRAVIAPPMAVSSIGAPVPGASVSIGEWGDEVIVELPPTTAALVLPTIAGANPVEMCAQAFERYPNGYAVGCGAEPEEESESFVTGMDWAPDGTFVFTLASGLSEGEEELGVEAERLYRANEDGSEVSELETPGFSVLGSPRVAPDGQHMTFKGCSLSSYKCGIVVTGPDGEDGTLVVEFPFVSDIDGANFSPDSRHILYLSDDWLEGKGLYERQITESNLSGGETRTLTSGGWSWSESWERPLTHYFGIPAFFPPAVSPVTGQIAINPWMTDIRTLLRSSERLDVSEMGWPADAAYPAFSPTREELAFSRERLHGGGEGNLEEIEGEVTPAGIYTGPPDGSYADLVVASPDNFQYRAIEPSFSPDGSRVAFLEHGAIYTVSRSGGTPALVTDGQPEDATTLAQAIELSDPSAVPLIEKVEAVVAESYARNFAEYVDPPLEEGGGTASAMSIIENWVATIKEVPLKQVEYCIDHPGECRSFLQDRSFAISGSELMFTGRGLLKPSTTANAFQHGDWTALMVRDSEREVDDMPAGLWFAITHEKKPYTNDARQDLINDLVGQNWFLQHGVEDLGSGVLKYVDRLKVCEALLFKSDNAIFVGGGRSPFAWAKNHEYFFERLVYRKLRAERAESPGEPLIVPNGRSCSDVWSKITDLSLGSL